MGYFYDHGRGIMIAADKPLLKVLYQDSSVKIGAGCLVEYNMNNLLDNILVESSVSQTYLTTEDGKINMFKQLFPIDSIIKPNRPENSGVKYFILWPNDLTDPSNLSKEYNTKPYPTSTAPRIYYPAVTNYYKYWVTPENSTFDITVNYVISSATISSAYSTGNADTYPNRVVYTTTSPHGFNQGQTITISGGTSLNLAGVQTISSVVSPTQFIVTNSTAATTSTGGTVTLVNSSGTPTPTKHALANKVVVKFEKYHLLPSSCKVQITYTDNTNSGELTFSSASYSNGSLILYYNGTTWIAKDNTYIDGPYTSTSVISWPAPKQVKSVRVWTTVASGAGRIYGITEISTRWVKDITGDVVSFEIEKESTLTDDSLLPVGTITANNMQMSLSRYDESKPDPLVTRKLKILSYNREDLWTTDPVPNDVIYLYKNIMLMPYFIVYHTNGTVVSGSTKYDRIKQGVFYLDTYEIETYGDTQVNALDGAKYLMETLPIDLYLEDMPITSIIMAILDTIGFTNYNFNMDVNDTSVPLVKKWWTDNEKTTWEHLQELCRDIQMNAFFDDNNVLQFYSRNNIYSKSNIDWKFFEKPDTVTIGSGGGAEAISVLPSIVDFSQKELASANQVKVIWRTPITSLYENVAEPLWTSEPSFLIAASVVNSIPASDPSELVNLTLNFDDQEIKSTFNFNGYLLLNSEIFEYDAIEFKYQLVDSSIWQQDWIESKSQWAAVRAQSKIGTEYFKPTGRVRVKKRAALGTVADSHKSTAESKNTNWQMVDEDKWDE